METLFTKENASLLLGGVLSVAIPYAVSWFKSKDLTWPDYIKFAIAALLSLIAGFLTAYISDTLSSDNVVLNASVVLTATQIVYFGAFRGLGLEKFLFPRNHAVTEAMDQVKARMQFISTATAKAINDPADPTALSIRVDVARHVGESTITK
jgi:ABC-type uncharacterized transport system permease subunit